MKWNELTMKERADLMALFLDNGVSSLEEMRHIYDGTKDNVPMEVDEQGNLIGSIAPATVTASLSRDEWNDLYRQGKVSLSDIPRKYQSYIQGDPRNSGMMETIKQGRQKFLKDAWNLGEVVIDSLPFIGDIKGLTLDPYLAYKNGGVEAALTSLMIGSVGVLPGGDALKFMKRITPEEAAVYLKRLKKAGISADVTVEDTQRILNDRVDRINKKIADRVNRGERISISGNRGIDEGLTIDTYNKEGNIGEIKISDSGDHNGIKWIENTSKNNIGYYVPDQTVYGLDAARQVSNSMGRTLISGELLIEPEKTLKGHQHLLFRELPEQGLLDSRNLEDFVARRHVVPDRRSIMRDLSDLETVYNMNPGVNGSWAAHSYPTIFNDLPMEIDGRVTYLRDPKDSWVLEYMDDRPGFYRREIMGVKEPKRYPHTVYSRFPDVRSFDEKVLTPKDMTYGIDFGVFEFRNGGELKPAAITERVGRRWDNFWWQKLRKPKDYSDKVVDIPDCARWSNAELRKRGYNIWGDAWTRSNNRAKKIVSGYDGLEKPEKYSYGAYKDYVLGAADNVKKNFDWRDLEEGDIVGLYFRGSPNYQKAFLEGANGEVQTHTGHVVYRKGKPYIAHNVHGDIVLNKAKRLMGRKHPYGIVSVYRPY